MPSDEHNPFAAPEVVDSPSFETINGIPAGLLQSTGTGLGILYTGFLLCLVSVIAAAMTLIFAGILNTALSSPLIAIFAICGVGAVVGVIMTIVGPVLCLSVPQQVRGRIPVLVAVLSQCCIVPATALTYFVPLSWNATFGIYTLVYLVLFMASMVSFSVFLSRLSRSIGRDDLVKQRRPILVSCGLTMLSIPFIVFYSPWVLVLSFLLIGAAFTLYGNLIQAVGRSIRKPLHVSVL